MDIILRKLQQNISDRLFQKKIIILYGARQVGKTTLVKKILADHGDDTEYFNCEAGPVQRALDTTNPSELRSYLGDKKIIVLDEAQVIESIGLKLKLIADTFPEMQVIATGSSSFELADKISEPLTGRAARFTLYPLSLGELINWEGRLKLESALDKILRFGLYPSVYSAKTEEKAKDELAEIADNYLYKDVLSFEGLRKSGVVSKLLELLALQIGSEVSIRELATALGINHLTVERYINILEQAFIIKVLRSFSRNLRKEVTKSFKVYFYDLGIRNHLINNLNPLSLRNDVGALWENFCIIERLKHDTYRKRRASYYFWRTYDGQEIDLIEDEGGKLSAFEFKWNKKVIKEPHAFKMAYPDSGFEVVNKESVWNSDFLIVQ